MKKGNPWFIWRRDIIDAVQNYSLSKEFGWTPTQISELTREEKRTYLKLMEGTSLAKPKGQK